MKVNERGGQYSGVGGLIGHSTGRRSLSTVGGDTRVSPQPWREIDAHDGDCVLHVEVLVVYKRCAPPMVHFDKSTCLLQTHHY